MICTVCQRPDRLVDTGQVCPGCAHRIACDLHDIPDLYARISLYPGSGATGPRVTGSREAPLPLRVDALDLTMPARSGYAVEVDLVPVMRSVPDTVVSRSVQVVNGEPVVVEQTLHVTRKVIVRDGEGRIMLRPPGDQTGLDAAASMLFGWVDDWRDHRAKGEGRPEPDIAVLAGWLGLRLADACAGHPAVDEFAADMRRLVRDIRAVIGDAPVRPERLAAWCWSCDLLTLVRVADPIRPVQCRACAAWCSEDEYRAWSLHVARSARMAA